MAALFVPSLQHSTCSRLVASVFNHLEVHKNFRMKEGEEIKSQVTEKLSQLTPCISIQEMLKKFIDPLFNEVDTWLKIFEINWFRYDDAFESSPVPLAQCWLSDGTIDREMAMKSLVKNENNRPWKRFIFACEYCFFDDVLELWKILYKIEKAYLGLKSTPLVKHWVEWLESSSNKDLESFAAWTLGTDVWSSNVYIMKHTVATLSPAKKSEYLLKALIGKKVLSADVMYFCMSMLTKDEQEQVFRESPVEVFRCVSSWSKQSIFNDVMDRLQPYLTEETFLKMLQIILKQIIYQYDGFGYSIEVLKNLWSQSPRHLQNIAINDIHCSKPLLFLLAFDVSLVFPKEKFLECLTTESFNALAEPDILLQRERERINDLRRLLESIRMRRQYPIELYAVKGQGFKIAGKKQ